MCIMGIRINDQVGGQADVVGWEDGKGSENQGKQVRARAPSGPASPRRRWHPCPAAAAPPPCGRFAPPCTDLWSHPAQAGRVRGAGGELRRAAGHVPSRGTRSRCKWGIRPRLIALGKATCCMTTALVSCGERCCIVWQA